MKELSIEEKAKAYDEAKARVSRAFNSNRCTIGFMNEIFPELKESEDERIRKELITHCRNTRCVTEEGAEKIAKWIAFLEKQGDTNETINRDKFAQDVLRGAAINLIVWIDYNAAEGNMCLSNMECKDIEDALVSGDWDKIYAYIKKKLEKQDEQKPAWSIKEKLMLNDIIEATERSNIFKENYQRELIDWLKSIKQRIGG